MSYKRNGYVYVYRDGRVHLEHRLTWERHCGPIPPGAVIHHINGKRDDNRISNLELVSNNGKHRQLYHCQPLPGKRMSPLTDHDRAFINRRLPVNHSPTS